MAITFLTLLIPSVFAAMPGDYWGKVYIAGEVAPNGVPITAYVNNEAVDSVDVGEKIASDYYELIISDATEGDIIIFMIGSVEAEQTAVFSDGAHERLDLSISEAACGDTICNGDETKESCSEDCGEPEQEEPTGTSSSSGSGSSSSSSSSGGSFTSSSEEPESETSEEEETSDETKVLVNCTEWSECYYGEQTRICTDPLNTEEEIEETRGCSLERYCGDGVCSEDEDCAVCETDCGVCEREASITGLAIFGEPTTIALLLGLLALILLILFFYKKKKKKEAPKSKYTRK